MKDLRQRALGTVIRNAIFSPASALVIAAGIVLVGLGVQIPILGASPLDVPPVGWLALLAPLWLAVVGLNIANRKAGEQAVQQMLRDQYDVKRIANPNLRMNVAQAIAYRERIDQATERFTDSAMRERVRDVANQVDEWVRQIYTLASRLDVFRNDSVIQRDLTAVPESINALKQRLANEDDASIRRELSDTIARRQAQYNSLLNLENTMERADLQLENTLTSLGTVYSQMLLIDARDVDSSKTQRLRENIAEQVHGLQDVLTSMDEVYGRVDGQAERGRVNMSSNARAQ
jgi:hypothetical protein